MRLDALEELVPVHVGTGISHDSDALGEKIVSMLRVAGSGDIVLHRDEGLDGNDRPDQTEPETDGPRSASLSLSFEFAFPPTPSERTVFFLARSPDAPRTTMVVLSFNSIVLSAEGCISRRRHPLAISRLDRIGVGIGRWKVNQMSRCPVPGEGHSGCLNAFHHLNIIPPDDTPRLEERR